MDDSVGQWPAPDYQRAGARIRATRVRRRAAWRDRQVFAEQIGVGYRTVGDIERGQLGRRKGSYSPEIISTIEAALGWASGSYEQLLRGGEPIDLGEVHDEVRVPARVELDMREILASDDLADDVKDQLIAVVLERGRDLDAGSVEDRRASGG